MMNINLLDVRGASDLWKLSPAAIKRKCQKGVLRAVKVGGIWLIEPDQPQPIDERKSKARG